MGRNKGGNNLPKWTSVADPIHGIIQFDREDATHCLLLDVINCRAFQRLRRIKQMGLAEFVFPGATHSRFAHSLGATHLMMEVIKHFNHFSYTREMLAGPYEDTGISLERLLLLGILTHDIGHTPLSHTLEDVLHLQNQHLLHDEYWNRKILTEDPELQGVWKKYGPKGGIGLPEAMLRFVGEGGVKKHFMGALVSSQLDMDRLDYLQRDSHFLGVQYGRIEADRIISNLVVTHLTGGKQVLGIREEAIPAVEHYLFGRHQAYKMALHALDKASEALVKKVLDRFRWARDNRIETGAPCDELYTLMTDGKSLSTEEFLRMDDCYLWQAINLWSVGSQDSLLKELAERMLRHNLLKFVDLCKYQYEGSFEELEPVYGELRKYYEKRGIPFEFGFEETVVEPKPLYQRTPDREPIWVRTGRGDVVDLGEASSLSLYAQPHTGKKHLVFVWDKDAKHFLLNLLEKHLPARGYALESEEEDETIL